MDSLLTPIISAGISALVSYYVTIYTKDRKYKNEYYKKVIDKRVLAYENLEKLIAATHFSHNHPDGGTYRDIFASTESYSAYVSAMRNALLSSMWMSLNASTQLSYLNQYVLTLKGKYDFRNLEELRKAGVEGEKIISSMRQNLEDFLKKDLFNLHDVERFFRSRR